MPAIMRQLFAGVNSPADELPLAQLRVCGILQNGARSMSALSRELGVTLSALTQIADRLERAGLVNRVAEEDDRRVRCLSLTPRGERIMLQREEYRIQRVLTVLDGMAPGERINVANALETLLRACVYAKSREVPDVVNQTAFGGDGELGDRLAMKATDQCDSSYPSLDPVVNKMG
jgi:DNA-binding MarR family transcriptional regulator